MTQEQIGRQVNACVFLLINEVEISIYRFLGSGAKNSKKQPWLVELGINQLTSRWTINVWQVTISPRPDFNQSSIKKAYHSTGNARLLEERKYFFHLWTEPQLRRCNRSTGTLVGWSSWPMSRLVHHFLPENLSFFVFFFLTLKQSL